MKRAKFLKIMGSGAMGYLVLPPRILSDNRFSVSGPGRHADGVEISGVYPHLAVFNKSENPEKFPGECGIGAVVPWADRLWFITYCPHAPLGSSDKLYTIDKGLHLVTRPESVGGTPACRMLHRESHQLIIGPYFIDRQGNIRVIPPKNMPGRLTAVARHLKDPANYVYFYDMEGKLYEVNVHSLEVKLLFKKPIPGWHGKGGYTAQHRVILANNGQTPSGKVEPGDRRIGGPPQNSEQRGVLAEWDGNNWNIIRRRQFTEVTGPGGIEGAPDDKSVAWSLGWDKRSVILMLLDGGEWVEWRLPKATHTYDSVNGWYTEWPRIRSVGDGKWLMDMHGMLYDFPASFSKEAIGGIQPLCNHLLMITDFCRWGDGMVFSTDMTSMMENKLAGQSQSNLWFGSRDDLQAWGPVNGWGGVWMDDAVEAGQSSDPYLIGGFDNRVVHMAHSLDKTVTFTFEIYTKDHWKAYRNVKVPAGAYRFHVFPEDMSAVWIRVKTDLDCRATVYFHYASRGRDAHRFEKYFTSLAPATAQNVKGGLLRPAGHNTNLQYLEQGSGGTYYEIDERMRFSRPAEDRASEVAKICALTPDFEVDEASVIVHDASGSYRLPKADAAYDAPHVQPSQRGRREVVTERSLLNAHGTFYEIANESGMATMRPICTHKRAIADYCSWRGLLVMAGTATGSKEDGHYFPAEDGQTGLWFGAVDDLWKLGQPVGHGGPWKDTAVKASGVSLPYLMTGYDKKKMTLTADHDVVISVEVDFDHQGWHLYRTFPLKAGKPLVHMFPAGYSAHWLRCKVDRAARVTVELLYS